MSPNGNSAAHLTAPRSYRLTRGGSDEIIGEIWGRDSRERSMGIDFIGGVLMGASSACLVAGVVQWFSNRRRARLKPDPFKTNGVVTKIEQRKLNGAGLTCVVSQSAITLFFALLLSEDGMYHHLLALIIAWFAATFMFGVILAIGGYRSETSTYGYEEQERA
jgi:hypothetical protein